MNDIHVPKTRENISKLLCIIIATTKMSNDITMPVNDIAVTSRPV